MINKNKLRIGLGAALFLNFLFWSIMFLEISFFNHEQYKGLLASINFILNFITLLLVFIFTGLLAKRLNRSVPGYCFGVIAYFIPPIILLFLGEKANETGNNDQAGDLDELNGLRQQIIDSHKSAGEARKRVDSSLKKFTAEARMVKAEQDEDNTVSFVVIVHEMMKPADCETHYGKLITQLGLPVKAGNALTLLSYGEQINPDVTLAMTFLTMQGPAYGIDINNADIKESSFEDAILGKGILLWA